MKDIFNKKGLLTIAFVEGACVMAVEPLGAKMITPFFGSSMYVWIAVLGVTFLGMAFLAFFLVGDKMSDFSKNAYILSDLLLRINFDSRFVNQKNIGLSKVSILKDDKPELVKMYIPVALKWRSMSIEYNFKKNIKE